MRKLLVWLFVCKGPAPEILYITVKAFLDFVQYCLRKVKAKSFFLLGPVGYESGMIWSLDPEKIIRDLRYGTILLIRKYRYLTGCVPDPKDPHVFGPPGSASGSIIYFYGFGSVSESFNQQAKNWRKTLISTVLWFLYDFLSLKNDVSVPSKSNKHKNLEKKYFLLASGRSLTKRAGSEAGSASVSQRYGSASGSVSKCHGSGTLVTGTYLGAEIC